MKQNNNVVLAIGITIVSIFLMGCNMPKNTIVSKNALYDTFPKELRYDTLEDIFLYENFVDSYRENDVTVKQNGFVKENNKVDLKTYMAGYYDYNLAYLQRYKDSNSQLHFDSASINNFHNDFLNLRIDNGTFGSKTAINPYCNLSYLRLHMKVEVLYLDSVWQRIPLLMNCEDYNLFIKKHSGKNYEVAKLPTYIITKVFYWNMK